MTLSNSLVCIINYDYIHTHPLTHAHTPSHTDTHKTESKTENERETERDRAIEKEGKRGGGGACGLVKKNFLMLVCYEILTLKLASQTIQK